MNHPNRVVALFPLLFMAISLLSIPVEAQSGRKRPENSAPPKAIEETTPKSTSEPTKNPANPAKNPTPPTSGKITIPATGVVVKEEHSGLNSHYILKNGLTIVVKEDHSVPVAACNILIKTGTAADPEGQAGISQATEQALVESTGGNDDFLGQVRQLGGIIESNTNVASTNLAILGPATNFSKLLELQFQHLSHPNFSTEVVNRATKLVSQSAQTQLDHPLDYSQQRTLQVAFNSNSTSAVPLANLSKEQIQAYYDRYYRANNLIIVITGDISANSARIAVQKNLGGMKPLEEATKVAPLTSASPNMLHYLNEKADINQTIVSVAYPVTNLPEKETLALEVMTAMLNKGRAALLPKSLIDPAFASQVNVDYLNYNSMGFMLFQLQTSPEKLAKAEGALFDRIEKLRRVIFSNGELQRAKSLLEKQHYEYSNDLRQLSYQLAYWESRSSYKDFDNYVERINEVQGEDIQKLAAQYFNFHTAIVHEYEPKTAPVRVPGLDATLSTEKFEAFINIVSPETHRETITKDEIVIAPEVAITKEGTPRRAPVKETSVIETAQPQPVHNYSTLRGPSAYVREDASKPLLTIGIYFQGGRIIETEQNSGITELMLRTMLRGTQRQDGSDLALILEQLGAEIKIVNEPDFFGYNLEVLSRNAEPAMKLLLEILEQPAFDKDALNQEKTNLLANIHSVAYDGQSYTRNLAFQALYSPHPYGLPRLGVDSAISLASTSNITEWYQKSIKNQLPIVFMVGDTEGSALVGRFVADGFSRPNPDKSLAVRVAAAQAQAVDRIESLDRRQTTQTFAFIGPEGKSNANYTLEVIRQIIDGPNGRFLKLLQQQHANFTLHTALEPHQQCNHFLLYLTSSPEDEKQARSFVDESFQQMITSSISDNELATGKNCALAYLNNSLRHNSVRALAYADNLFSGRVVADIDNLSDKIQDINRENVQKVLQTYFVSTRRSIGVLRGNTKATTTPQP